MKVKVTQVLKVWKSIVIEIDADNFEHAEELISTGEVDLPSGSDDANAVWTLEHSSLENEEYEALE